MDKSTLNVVSYGQISAIRGKRALGSAGPCTFPELPVSFSSSPGDWLCPWWLIACTLSPKRALTAGPRRETERKAEAAKEGDGKEGGQKPKLNGHKSSQLPQQPR